MPIYHIRAEHGSGAERKVLPLRIKPDFSDLRSPLRSRSAAPRSPLRSAPPEFWTAPLRFRSAHTCHKLSRKQLPVRPTFALFYSLLW